MEAVDSRELRSAKQGSSDEGNSSIPTEQTEAVGTAKNVTTLGRLEAKPHPKPEPVRYGTFTIIPDTAHRRVVNYHPHFSLWEAWRKMCEQAKSPSPSEASGGAGMRALVQRQRGRHIFQSAMLHTPKILPVLITKYLNVEC